MFKISYSLRYILFIEPPIEKRRTLALLKRVREVPKEKAQNLYYLL